MSVANPLNPLGALKQGCWKRKGSEEEGQDSNSRAAKKAKYSWYVTLESESPRPTSSDEDESIYSVQGQETEYVRDTSDTSTGTWVTSSDEVTRRVEYEPASLSADENPFIDCLTSSDPEISQHIARAYVREIAVAIYDSDLGLADDSDDSLTSRDSEISHADYWTCVRCNNNNNNPKFRLCEKCYHERKLFLPPRPRGKRRRKEASRNKLTRVVVGAPEARELSMSQDSGLGSSRLDTAARSALSFEPLERIKLERSSSSSLSSSRLSEQSSSGRILLSENSTAESSSLSQPSGSSRDDDTRYASQESRNSLATTVSVDDKNYDPFESCDEIDLVEKIKSALSKKDADTPDEDKNKRCIFCTVGPKDTVFVHGRDSHMCCCYRCAMKVWKITKHCPICNRKVTDVIKVYYA